MAKQLPDNVIKWDLRFLQLASLTSEWSKDPSTQTGAVLVSPDRKDVVLGYNGFPKGMADSPELYANRELKYSRIVHCEMNAVLNARRSVAGFTLYTWPFLSCDRCAVHMIAAGVDRVVAPAPSADKLARWAEQLAKSKAYFAEARVHVTEYDAETSKVCFDTSLEWFDDASPLRPVAPETPTLLQVQISNAIAQVDEKHAVDFREILLCTSFMADDVNNELASMVSKGLLGTNGTCWWSI